ncbi:hypothetical protein EMCRGX_G017651 [Ephydatia muelleri]
MGDGRVTFAVDSVVGATEPLERVTVRAAVTERVKVACEATFDVTLPLVNADCHDNKFYAAVHTAYERHYPLVLTPDAVWTCIAQGFAQHVTLNAEKLRHLFVAHEGKKELLVHCDRFVKGSATNPWPEVFDDFSAQIRAAVGDEVYGALTPSFTTTGPAERAAAQLVVMDTFKEFFQYRCCTSCGIPEITLEGTEGDWRALRDKAMALGTFELTWWTDSLRPVLDQFVEAAAAVLFPYISEQRSKVLDLWKVEKPRRYFGMTSDNVPSGLASTPFVWTYYGTDHAMHFYAGFMAVSQDPKTLALRPEIGWAVADDSENKHGRSFN